MFTETRTVCLSRKDTPRPAQIIVFLERLRTGFILLHAHPQLVYCNHVKSVSVYLFRRRNMERPTHL